MAISPFMAAINQICDEKGLSTDIVIETVEAAIAAAYRKDYGNPNQIIRAKLNPESGQFKVSQIFEIVEEVEEEDNQITLTNASKFNKNAAVGEELEIPLTPHTDFGRIAAQTAKQVIIQRIREAERDMLYTEFKGKEHQLLNGNVQQIEGENIIINLGKINGIMLSSGQIPNERYYIGQRLKIYITGVEESSKGPRVLISRTDPQFIAELFKVEVPEIASGAVEIKNISREAGSRTKISVFSDQTGLDPVGSCVGQRGTRVQAVLSEIGEEKIDIILWNEDQKTYIVNSLSPAKVEDVLLDENNQKAIVRVPDDQLSLAIGKGGQNVRLASKLCGWSIDIMTDDKEFTTISKQIAKLTKKTKKTAVDKVKKSAPEKAVKTIKKITDKSAKTPHPSKKDNKEKTTKAKKATGKTKTKSKTAKK